MKLLLDTHIFLWWNLDFPHLSFKHKALLEEAETSGEGYGLSIISLWEIAKLVSAGKFHVAFSLDQWFLQLEDHALVHLLSMNGSIILDSTRLGPHFHKDPIDQLIVATARYHELTLLTVDEKIQKSGVVPVV